MEISNTSSACGCYSRPSCVLPPLYPCMSSKHFAGYNFYSCKHHINSATSTRVGDRYLVTVAAGFRLPGTALVCADSKISARYWTAVCFFRAQKAVQQRIQRHLQHPCGNGSPPKHAARALLLCCACTTSATRSQRIAYDTSSVGNSLSHRTKTGRNLFETM